MNLPKIAGFSLYFLVVCGNTAGAGDDNNRPPDNRPPGSVAGARAGAEAAATSLSEAVSSANNQVDITNQVNITMPAGTGVGAQAAPTSNSLTVNEAEQPDDVTIRNTPGLYAPDVLPTVSCFKGGSAGIVLPGFGLSGAAGKIDEGCVKRENIRLAYAMGAQGRALFLWCQQPSVFLDFGGVDECLTFQVASPTPRPTDLATIAPAAGMEYVSRTEAQMLIEERELELEAQQEEIEAQDDRLDRLERNLARQEAAAERERQERNQWKQEIQQKYLDPIQTPEPQP